MDSSRIDPCLIHGFLGPQQLAPKWHLDRLWTNLVHDFTAVTFSVKLAVFCELGPFL